MKEFAKKLKNDPQFVEEFTQFMHSEEPKIKEGSEAVGKELNKLMSDCVKAFAEKKGMTLTEDAALDQQLAGYCATSAKQLNEMILKQFTSYEG